jgi:hypothetical protein
MEITTRPIRPDERAILETRYEPEGPRKGDVLMPTLLTAFPIWFALLYVNMLLLPRHDVIETAFAFGTLVASLYFTFRFYMKRHAKVLLARNATAVAEAEARLAAYRKIEHVEVWNVRIADALEVEIDEDTGSQFYLQLEDGRVLVLDEEWLERDDEERPWAPNRELIVTRLPPPHHRILDVRCVGAFFDPSHTREPTAQEWEHYGIRGDGEILPGPLSRYTTR